MQDARDRRRKFCSECSVDTGNRENGAIQEPSSTVLTSFDNLADNCIDAESAVDTIILVIAQKQTFLDNALDVKDGQRRIGDAFTKEGSRLVIGCRGKFGRVLAIDESYVNPQGWKDITKHAARAHKPNQTKLYYMY